MKKRTFLDVLAGFLPHINIALALFFITCFIVDRYNRAMAFINNEYTKYGLLVFSILVIAQSVIFVLKNRKARREERRADGPKQEQEPDRERDREQGKKGGGSC